MKVRQRKYRRATREQSLSWTAKNRRSREMGARGERDGSWWSSPKIALMVRNAACVGPRGSGY